MNREPRFLCQFFYKIGFHIYQCGAGYSASGLGFFPFVYRSIFGQLWGHIWWNKNDEIGLLKPTDKSDAGYRLYDDKALEQLQQIQTYRNEQIKANIDEKYGDGAAQFFMQAIETFYR